MRNNLNRLNIDTALPYLCDAIMRDGDVLESRNGPTRDTTHIGVTLSRPWEREITLPGRKHNLAAQIAETMWVLAGRDDIEFLGHYLPRAADFSDDGKVWRGAYGKRIRRWFSETDFDYIDQLKHVINLLKEDNNTRRAVIAIYDPEIDCAPGKDIPCNDFLTFSIRQGKLDVGVTIRSNDLMWGWSGINAFEWSALQEVVAGLVGVEVGALHFSITSLHIYEQHWDKAEKLASESVKHNATSIFFDPDQSDVEYLDGLIQAWFQAEGWIRTGEPGAETYVEQFPEPMLRSWLRVLQWWWSGDAKYLVPLAGTRLHASAQVAMQPVRRVAPPDGFVDYVTNLHTEKHAAYGDSWKRRGEMLGIMANIARKIDRLGGGATADETSADTAIDLLVYLAKYRWWLTEEMGHPTPGTGTNISIPYPAGGDPGSTNNLISSLEGSEKPFEGRAPSGIALTLDQYFNRLEEDVKLMDPGRYKTIDTMLPYAYALAHLRWTEEQAAK